MSPRSRKLCVALLLAVSFSLRPGAWPASASDASPATSAKTEPWREAWAGAIAGRQSWSAYSGTTFAPFGAVTRDGWRLRTVGGYGKYKYSYMSSAQSHAFKGTSAFSDLLLGYQLTLGPATIKGFAGGSAMGHLLDGYDPLNRVQGLDYGAKLGLETWVNIGTRAFNQLDASWAAAFGSIEIRSRTGYRLTDSLSAGVELAASSNTQLKNEWLADKPWRGGSGGAFARYEWASGEVSVSAGLASAGGSGGSISLPASSLALGSIAKPSAPYFTANWLTRF